MAENVVLYSRNYLLDPYVSASASPNTTYTGGMTIDRDTSTYWQSATSVTAPYVKFYLGPTARTSTRLLFRWNLSAATVSYSNDDITYLPVKVVSSSSTTAGVITLSSASAKYIKITCSGAIGGGGGYYKIYELALTNTVGSIDWKDIDKLSINELDDAGQKTNRTWNGTTVVTSLNNFIDTAIQCQLVQVTPTAYNTLRTARKTYPKVIVVPEPTTYPDRWYNCYWEEFNLAYAKPRHVGYEGRISWREC